jgi:hypothetical protein
VLACAQITGQYRAILVIQRVGVANIKMVTRHAESASKIQKTVRSTKAINVSAATAAATVQTGGLVRMTATNSRIE